MSNPDRMAALFRGFAGAHGTYDVEELNPSKNKQEIKKSARTVRRPVTADLWARHLAGSYHLGVIPIAEDSHCWWGAVDIDNYDGLDHADLVRRISDLSLPGLVCRTKSGGAHIYVFFSEPIPAGDVISKLQVLSTVLGHGGCEIFPKQSRIVVEEDGLGNWINMPYFGGDQTRCFAYKPDGLGMSLGQFLSTAEGSRMTRQEFTGLKLSGHDDSWEQAPPCLQHLASVKLKSGEQNLGLFSFAIYAKKRDPDNWPSLLRRWATELCDPPHSQGRLNSMIQSVGSKDYGYKCHSAPCATHCNRALCQTRPFGIGSGGSAEIIESVSILDTDPPLFYVFLQDGGKVECDGNTLLSPRAFQSAALEQLQIVLPQYKQEMWHPLVREMVEKATRIETSAEVGVTGELFELLEQFCTDQHRAERREEIITGKPWRDEERGFVWFRLRDLTNFLDRAKFQKLGRGKVTERIKNLGGRKDFFNMQGTGVNVWGLPIASLSWKTGTIPTPDREEGPV